VTNSGPSLEFALSDDNKVFGRPEHVTPRFVEQQWWQVGMDGCVSRAYGAIFSADI
jgi:hypothetical protein